MAKKKVITTTTVTTEVIETDTKLNAYVLLDRSGSMNSQWIEALGAVNGYVEDLVKEKAKGDISVAVFDSNGYDVVRERIAFDDFSPLTTADAHPRGSTPLLDSTARILNEAFAANAERTVVIIVTDGEENTSHKFNKAQVQSLIKDAENRHWQVVYLGANFNKFSEASNLGLGENKFMTSSTSNMRSTISRMSADTVAYGSAKSASAGRASTFNFSDADRTKGWEDKK